MDQSDKLRIVGHMNRDHKLALKDFLLYYKGIKVKNIYLDDLSLKSLYIFYDYSETNRNNKKSKCAIDFKPPLKSYSDVRKTIIKMAKECAQGLGYSPVQIKTYRNVLPSFANILKVLFLLFIFYILLKPNGIDPNQPLLSNNETFFDLFSYNKLLIARNLIRLPFITLIGVIHLSELIYSVKLLLFYRAYPMIIIAWSIMVFIEGYPAVLRLKNLIATIKPKDDE